MTEDTAVPTPDRLHNLLQRLRELQVRHATLAYELRLRATLDPNPAAVRPYLTHSTHHSSLADAFGAEADLLQAELRGAVA